MTSLGTTSLLQNATFLQNAFITTFLTSLGLETLRYILSESTCQLYSFTTYNRVLSKSIYKKKYSK